MQSSERPSKHKVFVDLLRKGRPSLYLDARRPGVIVPAHLRGEPHLVLQYGYDLPIPIPDLEVDEHGVRATLSFSKSPQRTVIPWSAVYVVACDDGRGVLYPEDVPDDVSIIAAHPQADRLSDDPAEVGMDIGMDVGIDGLESSADGRHAGAGDEELGELGGLGPPGTGSAVPGSDGPSGRISERLLRSVPSDGGGEALGPPSAARRRRKPQLRLVK
jgi:stringent starvation protein B